MIAQRIVPSASDPRPSCLWRCTCGQTLIARRIDGKAELHWRGKKRVKCPHCKAVLVFGETA